jgi:hypothetical protein
LIDEAFRAPHAAPASGGRFGVAELENGDRVVFEVSQVIEPDPGAAEQEARDALSSTLRQQEAALEFAAVVESLRNRTDIRLYPENL